MTDSPGCAHACAAPVRTRRVHIAESPPSTPARTTGSTPVQVRRLISVAAVKVPDRNLQELREQGFTIVEGFLAQDELKAAQEALWLHYPRPEEYFADPSAHQE